jgi:hypothetical protein
VDAAFPGNTGLWVGLIGLLDAAGWAIAALVSSIETAIGNKKFFRIRDPAGYSSGVEIK